MLPQLEIRLGQLFARHEVSLMRAALGVVFVWFGLLKFCPGLCDVEFMAEQTLVLLSFGKVPPQYLMHGLALWECAMGLTLMFAPRKTRWGALALRLCVISLLVHLAGTFLPLVLFRGETWKDFPYSPTLAGQYILKNLVLIAGAVVVGARVLVAKPQLALVPQETLAFPSRRKA